MAYRIAAIPMTLSDLHGHSPFTSTESAFSNVIFRTAMQHLTRSRLTERRVVPHIAVQHLSTVSDA